MAPTPPRSTRARQENDALRHLRAIVQVQTASARSIEKRTGVTNAQLFVLQALDAASAPMTIGELQAAVRTGQSAVSILVARLARAGLVTRATAEHDRRRRAVSLTAKGAKLAKRAPTPPLRRLLDAFAGLPEGDLRQLSHGLAALAVALDVGDNDPPPLFEKLGR